MNDLKTKLEETPDEEALCLIVLPLAVSPATALSESEWYEEREWDSVPLPIATGARPLLSLTSGPYEHLMSAEEDAAYFD